VTVLFYAASIVAVIATLMAVTRSDAVHALLFAVVSLLSVAVILFLLGAPFVAALEAIVYAGAIVVLFLFVVMMLGAREQQRARERGWRSLRAWLGAGLLSAGLLGVLLHALLQEGGGSPSLGTGALGGGDPTALGRALYGPYVVAVELASLLLLAGVVAAVHLSRPLASSPERERERERDHAEEAPA